MYICNIYIYIHSIYTHTYIIYWFSKAQGFHPLQGVTRGKPVPLDQLQPSALDRPFLAHNFVTFSIYIYVHIPSNLYEQLSLSIFGFYAQETFLGCIFGFLFLMGCSNPLTAPGSHILRQGVMVGYPNLATHTTIFAIKFGCAHKILVFVQHYKKRTITIFRPNTASRRDTTHTVRTSPTNTRFRKTIDL